MRRAFVAASLAFALAAPRAHAQKAASPQHDPCVLKGKTWTFTWDERARILAGPYPERWLLEGAVLASPGSKVQGSWQRVDQARAAMAEFMKGLREARDVVDEVKPVLAGQTWKAPLSRQPEIRLGVTATVGETALAPELVSVGLVEDAGGERILDAAGKAVYEVRISPEAGLSAADVVRVGYKVFEAPRWLNVGPDLLRLLCEGDAAGFDAAKKTWGFRVNLAGERCFVCGRDLDRPGAGHASDCWLAAAPPAQGEKAQPH